jgi:hypothetical protein
MRRRGNAITASSGNLLLDTLCNALGGILFIALLVVLLAHEVPVLDPGALDPIVTKEDIYIVELELAAQNFVCKLV